MAFDADGICFRVCLEASSKFLYHAAVMFSSQFTPERHGVARCSLRPHGGCRERVLGITHDDESVLLKRQCQRRLFAESPLGVRGHAMYAIGGQDTVS